MNVARVITSKSELMQLGVNLDVDRNDIERMINGKKQHNCFPFSFLAEYSIILLYY